MTTRQAEVLAAIRGLWLDGCKPPSVREICARLGIKSTNGVAHHLEALEAAGAIVRDRDGTARGVWLPGLKAGIRALVGGG